VGTTTTAGWQSIGLPAGITPAVGVPFVTPSPVASPNPWTTGTGSVEQVATAGSAITDVEVVGNPTLTVAATGGATIILRTMAPTTSSVYTGSSSGSVASTTTMVQTAPADGTKISVRLTFKDLPNTLN